MSWDHRFSDPIDTPSGDRLGTLRDAGAYITRLPKSEHESPAWQTAMRCLIQAADHDGPIEFARLGMMQAVWPKPAAVYRSARTEPKWHNRYKLVRDQ